MQKRMSLFSAGVGAAFLLAGSALAGGGTVYSDDFESYTVGGGVVGNNGWMFWDGGFDDATVSNEFAHGGTKSMHIGPFTDVVQANMDFTTGVYEHTCWTYVPTGYTGLNYLIALNQYTGSGDGANNWSLQLTFDSDQNIVLADGGNLEQTALIRDKWVEVRVVIDLDNDTQDIFYGNTQLVDGRSWSNGVSGGGIVRITCFDYYSGGSIEGLFYDDVEFAEGGGTGATPGTLTAVTQILGSDPEGNGITISKLTDDDNVFERFRSTFGFSALEPDLSEIRYDGTTTGTELVSILSRDNANTPNTVGKVRARNFNNNVLTSIGTYNLAIPGGGGNDQESIVKGGGTQYVNGSGGWEIRIRYVCPAVFSAIGFDVWQDQFVAFFN